MYVRCVGKGVALIIAVLQLAALSSCMKREGEDAVRVPSETHAELARDLQTVAGMRVLFAHQSVGADILDGVRTLAADASTPVRIHERDGANALSAGITHFKVGRNEDPTSKIVEYVQAVDGATSSPDVAILKLCYIDFGAKTDATEVANLYLTQLDALQARHPDTRVIAVTAPLQAVQTGPKAWLKKILGKPLGGYALNAKRHVFNERVRQHVPVNRLFDLARAESEGLDTTSLTFDGQALEAMNPAYTSDGGHLNEAGKTHVAREFIRIIASHGPR